MTNSDLDLLPALFTSREAVLQSLARRTGRTADDLMRLYAAVGVVAALGGM